MKKTACLALIVLAASAALHSLTSWAVMPAASAAPKDIRLVKAEFKPYRHSPYGSVYLAVQMDERLEKTDSRLMIAIQRGPCEGEVCREAFRHSIFHRAGLPEGRYFAAFGVPAPYEGASKVYAVRMGGFLKQDLVKESEQGPLKGWIFACDEKERKLLSETPLAFTLDLTRTPAVPADTPAE